MPTISTSWRRGFVPLGLCTLLVVGGVSITLPQAPLHAQAAAPRPMEPADVLDWKTIGPASLSADGKWLAYRYSPVVGDSEVVVRATTGGTERRFAIGEMPPPTPSRPGGPPTPPPGAGPAGFAFSDDGKWLVYTTYPTRAEAEKLRAGKKPIQTGATLVELETATSTAYPKVRQYAFAGDSSRALALLRYVPEGGGKDKPRGADLVLRDLRSATDLTIGGVAEYAFDKFGTRLAWTTDAEGQIGNGVSVRHLPTGTVVTIDSGKAVYEKPTWNEAGTHLAVLKGVEDKEYEEKRYSVVGTDVSGAAPQTVRYDPAVDTSFPADLFISTNRAAEWTSDGKGLLFGLSPATKKKAGAKDGADDAAPDPDRPDLVLWHWKDGRLQSQQQVQQQRDKRFTYLATWRVAEKRFIRLADDDLREVTAPKQGRWAVGVQRTAYELTGALEGRNYQDVTLVDMETGTRGATAKKVRWVFGQSPDSTKVLFFEGGQYHVLDATTGKAAVITKGAPVSFVDVEDDHNVVQPPVNPEGWTADSNGVVLSDGWDLWHVPVSGNAAVNLTGNGKRDHIRYDRVVLDPEEKGIDLAQPQYATMLGEWTKKTGVARVAPGKHGAEVLAFEAAGYSRLMKATHADVYAYAYDTPTVYPDLHVADASLKGARKLTDGQAQLAAYAWTAGARLVD
ncbi:MAG TPA: hypothetical protein VMF13_04940, partial [Luteitalea sp.]|nr:hypothetical protein [Luteitalea sp.]